MAKYVAKVRFRYFPETHTTYLLVRYPGERRWTTITQYPGFPNISHAEVLMWKLKAELEEQGLTVNYETEVH